MRVNTAETGRSSEGGRGFTRYQPVSLLWIVDSFTIIASIPISDVCQQEVFVSNKFPSRSRGASPRVALSRKLFFKVCLAFAYLINKRKKLVFEGTDGKWRHLKSFLGFFSKISRKFRRKFSSWPLRDASFTSPNFRTFPLSCLRNNGSFLHKVKTFLLVRFRLKESLVGSRAQLLILSTSSLSMASTVFSSEVALETCQKLLLDGKCCSSIVDATKTRKPSQEKSARSSVSLHNNRPRPSSQAPIISVQLKNCKRCLHVRQLWLFAPSLIAVKCYCLLITDLMLTPEGNDKSSNKLSA